MRQHVSAIAPVDAMVYPVPDILVGRRSLRETSASGGRRLQSTGGFWTPGYFEYPPPPPEPEPEPEPEVLVDVVYTVYNPDAGVLDRLQHPDFLQLLAVSVNQAGPFLNISESQLLTLPELEYEVTADIRISLLQAQLNATIENLNEGDQPPARCRSCRRGIDGE